MKKRLIILLITLIIVIAAVLLIVSLNTPLTGRVIENQENNLYTYTKAICNDSNYCQDNEITCKGAEIISVSPISGAAVQFSPGWEDPRDPETIEKIC